MTFINYNNERVVCKLSKIGLRVFGLHHIHRYGVTVPYKYNCKNKKEGFIRVKWNDIKSFIEYHHKFIELIPKAKVYE